ncbi:MAG: hypothetical protein Q8S31_04990 [Alphaproteobacteria bacterium]|nr:hypothetical protein [Alphaproteobacteria bacterium]
MKKIVLFISICFQINLAIAVDDEWPVFSNKKGAEYTLYVLKGIINKFPKTSQIENYTYKIDPASCELPLNPDDFNETQLVEYKIAEPSELDAHQNTANYALFIDDSKIDDSSLVVTRSEVNDIAIIDDFVSIEPHFDIIDDTQKEESLPTTKKKKRRTKKESDAKKIKKEKRSGSQKKEALTSSQLINPVHISKQNSTSAVPEFSIIEDNDDVTDESNIKSTPVSRHKSVSAPGDFIISEKARKTKSIAPTQPTKTKPDDINVKKKKKDDNCSIM